MIRYLSPEWFAAVEAVAGRRDPSAPVDERRMVIRQVITDGPDGDVMYRVAVENSTARVLPGDGPADLTLVEDYPTAVAIQQGALAIQTAFRAGRIRVSGNVGALLAHHDALRQVDAAFDQLRAITEYPRWPAGSVSDVVDA